MENFKLKIFQDFNLGGVSVQSGKEVWQEMREIKLYETSYLIQEKIKMINSRH